MNKPFCGHGNLRFVLLGTCTFYGQRKSKIWGCLDCNAHVVLPRKSYILIKGIVYPEFMKGNK